LGEEKKLDSVSHGKKSLPIEEEDELIFQKPKDGGDYVNAFLPIYQDPKLSGGNISPQTLFNQ